MHYSAIIPNKHIALSPLVAVFETRLRDMIHKKIKQVKARIHLDALELINGRPKPGDTAALWRLVEDWQLAVSAGSDFHRDTGYGPGLGIDTSDIPAGRGVWERL